MSRNRPKNRTTGKGVTGGTSKKQEGKPASALFIRVDRSDVIYADPWLKEAKEDAHMPGYARFVCSYEVDVVVDQVEERAFFRRTGRADELWIGAGRSRIGRVYAISRKGKELTACLRLLDLYFRVTIRFQRPSDFIAAGIVDASAYKGLVGQIEREMEENARKARGAETEIIKAARELGLYPRPTGTGPTFWQAWCPGTNHHLYINAAENAFGCGWCKRKGGIEELRAFVKERAKTGSGPAL